MATEIQVKIEHTFPDKTLLISCPYCWNGSWSTGHQPLSIVGGNLDPVYNFQVVKWSEEVCVICKGKSNLHVYPSTKKDPWLACNFCIRVGRSYENLEKVSDNYVSFTFEPCRMCHGLTFTFFSKKNPLVDPGYTGETKRLHPLD